MAQFGELLAELRKDRGLSQKDLAELFHLASSTISSYEIGLHSPGLDLLVHLADYFNVSTDYLLGRISTDVSPAVLNEVLVDGSTVAEAISIFKNLPDDRQYVLLTILKDIQFSSAIRAEK